MAELKTKPQRKKNLLCPYCGEIFDIVDFKVRIEVYRCSNKSSASFRKTQKCKLCKGTIALKTY